MRDTWNELARRGADEESASLFAKTPGASPPKSQRMQQGKSGKKTADGLDPEEPDYWETGFTLRELGPQAVRLWLGLQVLGLFFQLLLWSEVANHLYEYEEVIAKICPRERLQHGICVGPMWNISSWQNVVLSAGGGFQVPASYTFNFATVSSPPTFLLVVDPVASANGAEPVDVRGDVLPNQQSMARWSAEVVRVNPPQLGPEMKTFHMGQHAMTFEDLSVEAKNEMAKSGRVLWRATLTAHGTLKRNTRYVTFVEDAVTSHLKDLSSDLQCAFGQAWKAFNDENQGHSHSALSWSRYLLGIFLFVGAFMVNFVHARLAKGQVGHKFHLVVLAKFILQDLPQQLCIVLYLLGWFEATGLRCQLCLFNPQHCGADDAFHFTNSLAIMFTLLSSMANQLLIRPAFKRSYTEDDVCLMYTIRIGGACVSVLPFTTGICFATKSLLPAATFLHMLAAVPCGLGWLTMVGGIMVPCMICCDESCDDG